MRKAGVGAVIQGLGGGVRKEMLSRKEGSKVVRRIWEGVWPVWSEMVSGEGGEEVDVRKEEGGLIGDRFKTGEPISLSSQTRYLPCSTSAQF
jgi:Fanconi-associated nuclease 1